MQRKWLFWVICVGLVLAGVGLNYWSKNEFSRAVGHALIIAGFLAATVDSFLKERFLKEASWDVSKYLIGYNLPAEIQDRIRELMSTQLVRRHFEIHYRLSRPTEEAAQGKFKFHVEYSYELENVTNQTQQYQQYWAAEEHDNPVLLELRCDSPDAKAVYCLDGSKVTREKEGEPGVIEAAAKKVKIPPHNLSRSLYYRFAGKYTLLVPQDHSDIVSLVGPTINVTITVDVPNDVEFVAPVADVATTKRWEYRRVFLPGEHIHVRWFMKA